MINEAHATEINTLAKAPQDVSWYRAKPLALAVIVAGSATLLAACNPGGGSGFGRATLDIQATAPSYSANTVRSLAVRDTGDTVVLPVTNKDSTKAGDLTLNKAWIVIRSIELERDDDDDDENDDDDDDDDDDEIEFVGPFVVNLLTSEVTPDLPELSLPQGRYDEVEIEYGPLRSGDQGMDGEPLMDQFPDLGGQYSVYLEGGYTSTDGTYTDIDFRFTYDEDDEFELSGLDPSLGFDVNGDVDLIVAFRMARWFRFDDDDTNDDDVEFEQGVTTVDIGLQTERNVIYLDDDDSSDLAESVFEVIEENIEESADYGDDDDGDGELDSDEDDDDDDDWDDWDDDDDED
jgi:predicted small secreted protein